MHLNPKSGFLAIVACVAATSAFAQSSSDSQASSKTEQFGAAMGLQYGMDNCDVPTTAKQRADVQAKVAELKQQAGLTGDVSPADIKEALGFKTDEEFKTFCTGLKLTLPGSIAGLLADKPPSEWSKPKTASAAPAAPAFPAKVADWDVETVQDTPGQCQITRDYFDKNDNNAENVVILRQRSDGVALALTYVKWNWNAGQSVAAPLVTSEAIINGDAKWTADKTGKVLSTLLPTESLQKLRKTDSLVVKFDDGNADFAVPQIGAAIDALSACVKAK